MSEEIKNLAFSGTILMGMAHEIKNAMVAIKTFMDLLPTKIEDPEFKTSFYQVVKAEVERLDRMMGHVLEITRSRPPQIRLTDTPVVNLIENVLGNFIARSREQKVIVEKRYEDNLLTIKADYELLKQAFANIVRNSLQAMSKGGTLTVSVGHGQVDVLEPQTGQRNDGRRGFANKVYVSFEDTGTGIPKSDLEKVFEPFFSTREGGTGLGLYITLKIVEAHKAHIRLESNEGKGTTVTVSFPAE